MFGTALSLEANPLKQDLWKHSVSFMVTGGGRPGSTPERRLRILLDYVGLHANAGTTHVFDQRFDDLLSQDERRLRDRL